MGNAFLEEYRVWRCRNLTAVRFKPRPKVVLPATCPEGNARRRSRMRAGYSAKRDFRRSSAGSRRLRFPLLRSPREPLRAQGLRDGEVTEKPRLTPLP